MACMTNFDHHPLISEGGIFYISFHDKFHMSILVLQVVKFSQKLNMAFQDVHSIQSGYNVTAELFKYGSQWKLSNYFGFHRNQCKK